MPLPETFTPDELTLLSKAVSALHREYRRVSTAPPTDDLDALIAKIDRLRLIDKRVHFTNYKGEPDIGTLRGFRTEHGKTLAEITTPGNLNLVDPDTELHGLA